MIKTINNNNLILFCALVVSVSVSILIEYWVRRCGFLMTPDSNNYISASQSFKASGSFLSPDGSIYSNWPPLFPVILSLFDKPLVAMIWITLLCKFAIAFFVCHLGNRFLQHSPSKIAFVTIPFIGVHMLLISVFLWSEIIFLTLLLAYVYSTFKFENNKVWRFTILSVIGFLLCLQRNAGLFWVFATAIWFILNDNSSWIKRLAVKGLLVLISASGLIWWHFYNAFHLRGAVAFYERDFFADTVHNIEMILSCLGRYFLPVNGMPSVITGLLIAGILALYGFRFFRFNNELKLLALGIAIYTLGFLPIPGLDIHDMERYFAVILPMMLLFPLLMVENLSERFSHKGVFIWICVVIWGAYPISRMAKNAIQWRYASCAGVSDK